MKIIIIGGGAGGASVAARARRIDEHANILLIDKRSEISQATCGLPYYIGDTIKDRSRLIVASPKEFSDILNVTVRTRSEVTLINRSEKTVTVSELDSGRQYTESYDKLVLAPGAIPVIPDISGVHRPNIFALQSIDDMDAIKQCLNDRDCKHVVVIGAGFIGLEMADNLHRLGIDVTVVERSPQAMTSLDREMASLVHEHLDQEGVTLLLNESVVAISSGSVILEGGAMLASDVIILALGMTPSNHLARQCGLLLGRSGGVIVDDYLLTSDRNIFALGDSIELADGKLGERTLLQLAGPTQKQASVVAENIFGSDRKYRKGAGTAIAKVFDLTVATTGHSEKQLLAKEIPYQKSYIDMPSHASYYPDATSMTIKLLFAPVTGLVHGAQIVGFEGVDKRIDVLASAIQFQKTVYDLAELDLAYAPPYSSAKDPINIAGMVARNMIDDDYRVLFWDEFSEINSEKTVLLDVRTPEEYELGALPNCVHIPLEELRERMDELPRDKQIIIYCQFGKKGYFAYRILRQHGFDEVLNLSGGYKLLKSLNRDSDVTGKSKTIRRRTRKSSVSDEDVNYEIDATGLSCPGPIMKLVQGIKRINDGEYLLITASDPAFEKDVETWCKKTGNTLHRTDKSKSITKVVIFKPKT